MVRQYNDPTADGRDSRSFLVLPENRLAYTAAMQWQRPTPGRAAPLVTISGPAGVGKSHLARQAARPAAHSDRVAHVTAAEFAAEWDEARRRRTVTQFYAEYLRVERFVCEDAHALQGKPEAQAALVSIIDALLPEGGRVMLTLRRNPGEIPGLSRRLVDRCHGGVSAAILSPERASRIKLLTFFAGEHQCPVPADVIEHLADRFPVAPRELRGLLTRLVQVAVRRKCPIDVSLARTLLGDEPQAQVSRLADIAREVARQFGVSLRALRSQSRNSESLLPRQAAMYLARDLIGAPYAEIGRYFNDRSHSTVVHSCQRFQAVLQRDTRLASLVEAVRERLPAASPCRKPVPRLRNDHRAAG